MRRQVVDFSTGHLAMQLPECRSRRSKDKGWEALVKEFLLVPGRHEGQHYAPPGQVHCHHVVDRHGLTGPSQRRDLRTKPGFRVHTVVLLDDSGLHDPCLVPVAMRKPTAGHTGHRHTQAQALTVHRSTYG